MANTSTFFFYIGLGFNIATTIHVGISVGKKYVQKTKNLIYCSMVSLCTLTVIEVFLMYRYREQWALLFTKTDTRLIQMNLVLIKIWLILLVVDNMQHVFQGALKSLHYENTMLWTYFITYYPISLPITWYLSFRMGFKTKGLWIGFTGAVTVVILFFAYFLCAMDYRKQI